MGVETTYTNKTKGRTWEEGVAAVIALSQEQGSLPHPPFYHSRASLQLLEDFFAPSNEKE